MVHYTLPGMTEFPDIDMLFVSLHKDAREIFIDDVAVTSVYGGINGCTLCGGRNSFGQPLSLPEVEALITRYNDLGISCNVTFSNQLIDSADISRDSYGRSILEMLDNEHGNGVIVHADHMLDYVREHHPGLCCIASTTRGVTDVQQLEKDLGRFDRVVLDYRLTNETELLSSIGYPERLEIMVNEYCTPFCQARDEHYRAVSEAQLHNRCSNFRCVQPVAPQAHSFIYGLIEGDVFMKNEAIRTYARNLHIGSFKIVGRALSRHDVIDSFLYYLIKPECWYEVRDYLIHRGYL